MKQAKLDSGRAVIITGDQKAETLTPVDGGYVDVLIPYTEGELLRSRSDCRCHLQRVRRSRIIY